MKKENRFYVYTHCYASGPKIGSPFYVGKGAGTRASSNSSRNKHWHSVNDKYGRFTVLTGEVLTNEEACALEIETIKSIGIENLTNKSTGGDKGALGFKHSDEWKRKQSERSRINMVNRMASHDYKHPCSGRVLSEDLKKIISEKISEKWMGMDHEKKKLIADKIKKSLGNPETVKKRSIDNSGDKNPMYDKRVFYFIHESGEVFLGTQFELSMHKNINKGNVSSMVCGKRKTVSGWRVM